MLSPEFVPEREDFSEVSVDDSPQARERLPAFLSLEHPTLPTFLDLKTGRGTISLRFRPQEGTPISRVRQTREAAAALFAQAASAALFLGARGFPLDLADLEDARVEVWNGAPHLWLPGLPRSAWREPLSAEPASALLAALIPRLFGARDRPRHLLESYLHRVGRPARPETSVSEILQTFPFLGKPAHASIRKRCLGFAPVGFDERERRHRARTLRARLELSGRKARIFGPGASSLLAGEALRASLGDGAGEPRLEECAENESHWIRLEREGWDEDSIHLFDRVAGRRGVEVSEILPPGRLRPDELRDAAWIPSSDLTSSVELYEALHALAEVNPRAVRRTVTRFAASDDFASFLKSGRVPTSLCASEPEEASRVLAALSKAERKTLGVFLCHPGAPAASAVDRVAGSAPFAGVAPKLAAEGWFFEEPATGRWRVADRASRADLISAYSSAETRAFGEAWLEVTADPPRRIEIAVACESWGAASAASEAVFGTTPARERDRSFDALVRAWVAGAGTKAPAPALLHEAARLSEIGRAQDAQDLLEAAVSDPSAPAVWKREARFRIALASEAAGDSGEALRLLDEASADRSTPVSERSRASRLRARVLSGEGRFSEAEEALRAARADAAGDRREEIEVQLSEADLASRRGRFDEEAAIYLSIRSRSMPVLDEELEGRLLLREGMLFSDRREHRSAAARFAEALQLAGSHSERRGIALTDLAISTEMLGESSAAEKYFREALACFDECRNVSRRRRAAGNLAHFLIRHDHDEASDAIVERLLVESEKAGDRIGKMVALAFRGRRALRRGRFAAASSDRAEALALCEELDDRVERAELELDESDARLFFGDRSAALEAAKLAASRAPDRTENHEAARRRVEDLESWSRSGPAEAFAPGAIEAAFESDPSGTSDRVSRARAFFGEDLEKHWPGVCQHAREVLGKRGRSEFAEVVFASALDGRSAEALRSLRAKLLAQEIPLRLLDSEGSVLWKSPSFQRATWARTLSWEEETAVLEGEGSDPDSVAFLFETLWSRGNLAPASDGTGNLFATLGVVTADASMEALGARLSRIAPQNVTVFVSGESGTGKERIARAIHQLSPRSTHPFVAVNVAAFPDHLLEDELFGHVKGAFTGADRDRAGLFEAAHRGTLFLDEIGDLSLALQAKLLRVLQEREIKRVGENRFRPVDVRLVSATAKNLEKDVERGSFREDLYYRLKVASLALPPLRERGNDSVLLARHFLERYAREYGKGALKWSSRATVAIRAFGWPGNVRQLENAVMEATALADPDSTIDREGLPEFLQGDGAAAAPRGDYRERVDAYRKRLIGDALSKSRGNRTHAARELGVTRQALLYLIRELKIKG
jgi:transcriptional regulator with AAA-type ATPase domain/tetratricopeptide (TPR) repeat protein